MKIIQKIEAMVLEGLKISSVYLEPEAPGKYVAVIGIANWLPLGEGGEMPHHVITIDRADLPAGISIQGGEKHQDERIELGVMNEEQAEALILDIARAGGAPDIAGFERQGMHGRAYLTKPTRWGVRCKPTRRGEGR